MKWETQSSGKKSLNDAPPAPGGEGRVRPEMHMFVQVVLPIRSHSSTSGMCL